MALGRLSALLSTKKVTGPASAFSKVEFTVPIDIGALEQKYKLPRPEGHINVIFRVDARVKKWGGSYDFGRKVLTLYAPLILPAPRAIDEVVERHLSRMEETVEHELRHMMQMFLREAHGAKAGTRYGPKDRLPGFDPTQRVRHVEKDAYPNASARERYFLEPVEFYPNLETAVFRFKDRFDGLIRPPTKEDFEVYVGLKPATRDTFPSSPFFLAYRNHDPKRYRKAVSEAWSRLSSFIRKA